MRWTDLQVVAVARLERESGMLLRDVAPGPRRDRLARDLAAEYPDDLLVQDDLPYREPSVYLISAGGILVAELADTR